jgi:hypothetical protein
MGSAQRRAGGKSDNTIERVKVKRECDFMSTNASKRIQKEQIKQRKNPSATMKLIPKN